MDSRLITVLFLILILVETPILLIHEWNHFHPPPVLTYTIGPCGPVGVVLDGHKFEILHNQPPERIRLDGIDCSEEGQPHSTRAKEAASE
jgi:endonuclease YncB( thermonuclease family)